MAKDDRVLSDDEIKFILSVSSLGKTDGIDDGQRLYNHIQAQSELISKLKAERDSQGNDFSWREAELKAKLDDLQLRNQNLQAAKRVAERQLAEIAPKDEIHFGINRYDQDGDSYDDGIFLFFGDTSVKVSDNTKPGSFNKFISKLQSMSSEIEDNLQ